MLCQVHGHPQLRLPHAQDTQAHRDHQCRGQGLVGAELRAGQPRAGFRCGRHGRVKRAEPQSNLGITWPSHAPSSDTFKAAEDAKAVEIDAEDPAKTIQIRASLNPK
jgi:hypothetical protein